MWAAKVKINAHWLQRQTKLFSPADCLLGGFVSKKLGWSGQIDLQGLQLLNYEVGFIFHNPASFQNPGNFIARLSFSQIKSWVALSFLVVRSFVCLSGSVTSPLISTLWCFRPYKSYMMHVWWYLVVSGPCLMVSGPCLMVSGGVWSLSGGVWWC